MRNCSLKIVSFCVFISLWQAVVRANQLSKSELGKRSLLKKERAYLKTEPYSEDLKSFINQYRNKRLETSREKRSNGLNEDALYVIQNGNLVPLNSIRDQKRSEAKSNLAQTFTVVPLIIPINPNENKIRSTALIDQIKTVQTRENKPAAAADINLDQTTPVVIASGEEDNNNSTQEETQVLHKILEDVEGLMRNKQQGGGKDGVLCNANGSWISDAAGMRFDINYQTSNKKKFKIHIADRIPPNEDGFLCDGNWSVFGELPFPHSGVIIVLAVHPKDKHIATFIGECRVCEGSESVSGTWLIGRSSRDCKDQKATHKILSDIWRREQMHNLQKKHLLELGVTMKDED